MNTDPTVTENPRITRENEIYGKDQKDDLDGVTIPTPYLRRLACEDGILRVTEDQK